ncbi:hypothetical protein AB3N02_21670 [Priestia aryabhattai]|uniref:hypothetical protein n=1 Tax=Priestia aryabhattai TaxID=412384 RepID=UPI0039A030D8
MEAIELMIEFIENAVSDDLENFFESLTLEEVIKLHKFSLEFEKTCSHYVLKKDINE